MTDYQPVQKALASGADPAMLCTTCPWDRNCITPPSMTSADVEQMLADASAKDKQAAEQARLSGKDPGMPVTSLMTVLTFAGKDTSAQVCPVFALRLRSGGGRRLADSIRESMQSWDDAS